MSECGQGEQFQPLSSGGKTETRGGDRDGERLGGPGRGITDLSSG